MGANFVRLTVIADSSQLDVSLPVHRPVVEYIDDVITLLGPRVADPADAWALSSPAHGRIDLDDTLSDHQVPDGSTLHLTHTDEAAQSPFVDDVINEVRRQVDVTSRPWGHSMQAGWFCAVMSALLVFVGGVVALSGASAGVVAVGCAVLVAVAFGVAVPNRQTPMKHLAWSSGPVAALGSYVATSTLGFAESVAFALAFGALAVAAASYVALRSEAAALAGAVVGVAALAAAGAMAAGANATALCMWASIPLVLIIIVAPKAALATSGLLALVRQSEQMALVDRDSVRSSLRRGRAVVDGLVWAVSVLTVPVTLTISQTGVWLQGLAAAFLSVVVALHSRSFTHARHVGPLVVASLASAAFVLIALPRWLDTPDNVSVGIWVCATAVIVVGLSTIQAVRLPEVGAARVRRFLDTVDFPIALAYIPIVFLAQGIYGYFWP